MRQSFRLNSMQRFQRTANAVVPALAAMFLLLGLARVACADAGSHQQIRNRAGQSHHRYRAFRRQHCSCDLQLGESGSVGHARLWNRRHAFDGRLDTRAGLCRVRSHSLGTSADPCRPEKSAATKSDAARRVESVPEGPLLLRRVESWEVQRLNLHIEHGRQTAADDVAMVHASE